MRINKTEGEKHMSEVTDRTLKNVLIKKISKREIKQGLSIRLETEQRILVSAVIDLALDLVSDKLENGRINKAYLAVVLRRLEDFILFKFRSGDAARVVNFCEGVEDGDDIELSEWMDSKLSILLNHVPHLIVHTDAKEDLNACSEEANEIGELFDSIEELTEHEIVYNQIAALAADISLQKVLADDENEDTENVGKLNLAFVGIYEDEKKATAQIVAKIYKCLGLLEHNNILIAQRKDLIGDTVEETEKKTKKYIEDAEDCTLYLPEFDDMVELVAINENDKASVNLILNAMASQDNIAVIVSAYAENLNTIFKDYEEFYLCFRRAVDFSDNN